MTMKVSLIVDIFIYLIFMEITNLSIIVFLIVNTLSVRTINVKYKSKGIFNPKYLPIGVTS